MQNAKCVYTQYLTKIRILYVENIQFAKLKKCINVANFYCNIYIKNIAFCLFRAMYITK